MGRYSVIFHTRAEKEFTDSIKWYEDNLKGLGEDFMDEVKLVVDRLQENPFLYESKKKQFREALIKKFPFVLVYTINERRNVVNILSVFHTSRNPVKKYRKDE